LIFTLALIVEPKHFEFAQSEQPLREEVVNKLIFETCGCQVSFGHLCILLRLKFEVLHYGVVMLNDDGGVRERSKTAHENHQEFLDVDKRLYDQSNVERKGLKQSKPVDQLEHQQESSD